MVCGDTGLNPGPRTRCWCGICKGIIRSNLVGIQCNLFSDWIHADCIGQVRKSTVVLETVIGNGDSLSAKMI